MRVGLTLLTALCSVALSSAPALGIAAVGRRTFVEPFITTDANPKDQFILLEPGYFRSRHGRHLSLGFTLERRLTESLSVGGTTEWIADRPRQGPHPTGSGNLDLLLKYAAKIDRRHEFIFSVAAGLEAPTGSQDVGAGGDTTLRPMAMAAKGFGDLPDDLWRFHPVAIMGDAGLETAISHDAPADIFFYDLTFLYSIPYLETYVWDPRLPPVLRDLTPLVELTFRTTINGEDRDTIAFVSPGVAYTGPWYQLAVGGRLPMNDATRQELQWGVLCMIDIFYEHLIPELAATPWFE